MKQVQRKSLVTSSKNAIEKVLISALLFLSTFHAKAGGDVYEIYLNSKLILKQFATQPLSIKSLQLDKAMPEDRLVILYSHCGTTGKGRSIAIKNDNGNILKEWKFTNTNVSMEIPVKKLLQVATNKSTGHLNLYYSAQELPKGRMLTSLDFGNRNVTYHPAPRVYLRGFFTWEYFYYSI